VNVPSRRFPFSAPTKVVSTVQLHVGSVYGAIVPETRRPSIWMNLSLSSRAAAGSAAFMMTLPSALWKPATRSKKTVPLRPDSRPA